MSTNNCTAGSSGFTLSPNYRGYQAGASVTNNERVGTTYWGLHFIIA